MKLVIKKEPGYLSAGFPSGSFHYFVLPMPIEDDFQAAVFEQMGFIVVEVDDDRGNEILSAGRAALRHQIEIAILADKENQKIMAELNSPGAYRCHCGKCKTVFTSFQAIRFAANA